MSQNNKPCVSRKSYSSIPFVPTGIGPTIHETRITRGNRSTDGYDWTRKEADQQAGCIFNGRRSK